MTLRSRRIIYIFFILLFIIIAPIIILYAAGYRYNFQKHKIQKTGILILKSKPEGAKIFLNNKLQKKTTPAIITNLLPIDYLIQIKKDGYYPWEKTLPVLSSLTTFAEKVMLFKQNLPVKIIDGDIESFALSEDKQKMIYLQNSETGKEIWFLNLKNFQKSLLYRLTEKNIQILKIEWGKDNQKILITKRDENSPTLKYILLNVETQESFVYQNLNDFYFEFKELENKSIAIDQFQNIPITEGAPQRFLAILNQKDQTLSILDLNSGLIIFQTKANNATWLKNKNKILYINDFEIWVYDLTADQKSLINRYSREIRKSLWINDNYILVLFENNFKIIEMDERDKRNVIDLTVSEKIYDFDIDPEKQKIYFIGEIGNKKGAYELQY